MPTIALLIWPLVMLGLFAKLPFKKAALIGMFAGYLLLPEAFAIDLPGLPPIQKSSVLALGLLIGLGLLKAQARSSRSVQGYDTVNVSKLLGILILGTLSLLVINSFFTVASNGETIRYGPVTLPPLSVRDIISEVSGVIILAIPFAIARKYFSQPEDHRILLRYMLIAALAYSVLILIEVRLSPQLHNMVYGYYQHSFAQHVRNGYRPMVFLDHGLSVGFFLFSALIAAYALTRQATGHNKAKLFLATGFLLCLLLISRNLGATALAILFRPLIWLGRREQQWAVTIVTLMFLFYPAVRQAQLLPFDQILNVVSGISEDRKRSLEFRFNNEDILLAHALEKPLSGWGGWNRSRVFNERGEDISTTDGLWVIKLGTSGWLGYIGFFGLLTLPVLALTTVRRRKEIPIETMALALIMAGNFIYIVPNATLSPLAWAFAGAIAGFVQFDVRQETSGSTEPENNPPQTRRRNSYTRFA